MIRRQPVSSAPLLMRVLGSVLLGGALCLYPTIVMACALDNTASLAANGVRATRNTSAATNPTTWAPFTISKAFASGDTITWSESQGDLILNLPPAALAAPFRWTFGDGTSALGHTVTHDYRRPGQYRLTVSSQLPGKDGWSEFDSALVTIVPPGQLFQANLSYYALKIFDVLIQGFVWLLDAALLLVVVAVLLRRYAGVSLLGMFKRKSSGALHRHPR